MNDLKKLLHTDFDAALARTTAALKNEGFGVLTEIDVQDTLAKKLGVAMARYRILGACNPTFAHAAVTRNADAGLMMPCNVVVYERGPGEVVVTAVDPGASVAAFGDAELGSLAAEVRGKLVRVLAQL
jgi:uncharacterized protein (DUF302 family)